MSIKNDIEMVRDELNSEEKFFEKAVITEKFVKKYKNLMIGGLVVVVGGVASSMIYEANKSSKIESANSSLAILLKDATNTAELAKLKVSSPALHDVWLYSKAIADNDMASLEKLKSSKAPILSDLVEYEVAQNAKDMSKLTTYSMKQDAIYKDLAQVQRAVLLMNEGKTVEAHERLTQIAESSALGKISQILLHYGAK